MNFNMSYSMKSRFIKQKTTICNTDDSNNQDNLEAEKKKKEEKYKADFNFIVYINKFFEFFLEGYY